MIFDMQTLFSDAQAVTTGTEYSTNVLDMGEVQTPQHGKAEITRDIGKSSDMTLVIQVVEDFASGTSTTVTLQGCDAENFGTGVVDLTATGAVLLADLVAGYRFGITTFPEGSIYRYYRLKFVTSGTHTAGAVTAGLVFGRGNWAA